ncbi:hypothetical protein FM107_01615 [Sphingobacterium sp. JB170]|nr:hypothetical protein FM107_01615 [Sphingobacterium sp. JB170]
MSRKIMITVLRVYFVETKPDLYCFLRKNGNDEYEQTFKDDAGIAD